MIILLVHMKTYSLKGIIGEFTFSETEWFYGFLILTQLGSTWFILLNKITIWDCLHLQAWKQLSAKMADVLEEIRAVQVRESFDL